MGSWESQIRKKVLQARPFEAQADWSRMATSLAELPADTSPKRRHGLIYWQMAAALAILLLSTSVWVSRKWEEGSGPETNTDAHQAVLEPVLSTPLPNESERKPLGGPLAKKPGGKKVFRSATLADVDLRSGLQSVEASDLIQPLIAIIPVPPSAYENSLLQLSPISEVQFAKSLSPEVNSWNPSYPLQLNVVGKNRPLFVVNQLPEETLWKVGFFLNTEHSRRRVDLGDGSSLHYLFVNSGGGIGLMRRFREIWEAGIRLDMAELFLPAKAIDEGYADLLGSARSGRLILRRYFRKQPERIFQPYASLSTGLQQIKMDYLKITQLSGTPSPDDPAPNSRISGGWSLPGSIEQQVSALEQNPAYNIERFADYNRYLQLSQGLEVGAEFRILPHWSLNLESGLSTRLGLAKTENAELEVPAPIWYLNHRLGLQWAF